MFNALLECKRYADLSIYKNIICHAKPCNATEYIKLTLVSQRNENQNLRPQSRRDYPLNLSILISGGKETNKDSLSNGERKGKSPALNLVPHGCKDM